MKKKFSKILGIGLTLALLTSLLLTAAPVSALTQANVTPSDPTISVKTDYSIVFTLGAELPDNGQIVIDFPTGTDLTNVASGDVDILATSGIGTEPIITSTVTIVKSPDVATGPTLTISITDLGTPTAIGVGAIVQVTIEDVQNPDTDDDYTLDVSTLDSADATIEAAVTSADYEIEVPTISDLPGIVRVYNPTGILMRQTTGADAIQDAIDAAGEGYTIKIGPGTYTENPDTADAEVTLVATGTAALTIIVGNWDINHDDTVIDGLTLDGDIDVNADDFILQNSVIDDGGTLDLGRDATDATVTDTTFNVEDDVGVEVDEDGATITGSTFNVEEDGIGVSVEDGVIDTTVADSTFTGDSGIGITVAGDTTIDGNTFDGLETALDINGGTVTIKFNSIINSEEDGIETGAAVDEDVDATFNWWGTTVAADIADMITEGGDGAVVYEPFLTGTADAVLSASEVAVGETSLDASTTVGVKVSGATGATVISLAKYIANPQEAIADAIAFYDVYVTGSTDTSITLKFYAGDENSELYIWSADTEKWVELDAGFSVYGGYIYVTVDADVLDRTPFVVVGVEAAAEELDAPGIVMPEAAAVDVSLTPTFDWSPVTDADAYYFQLADNPLFVMPLVSFDGDLGRLVETAYTHVTALDYATAYHWRVKAVSGTEAAGDLLESAWSEYVFITMDEPVEPTPPVVVEETEPPVIIIEQPDIIVPLPDVVETPITPAWIYAIIGVGAVLVIALLVLIVRTRRVA